MNTRHPSVSRREGSKNRARGLERCLGTSTTAADCWLAFLRLFCLVWLTAGFYGAMKHKTFGLVFFAGIIGLFGAEESPPDSAIANETIPAGHSAHGEAFNEGPRQAAYFMGDTGGVHFPITTSSREVQEFFDQGVGQLHGFWYFEAERSFRHIAALEPDCAMAYWGMAMANINNRRRAKEFVQEAVRRKESVSPREQLWIESLEHFYLGDEKDDKKRSRRRIRDLEEIIHQYPDDIEAKAFLAVAIYQSKRHHPIGSYQAVDALIQQVLDAQPMHPAHHYRIHLWDYEKPKRALASAALCGQSAPGIAHMWHMPGHIFSRLRRYAEAAWQQEASARVDHARMMRDRVLPDQIHNFAHNNEWLIRNLNHLGRVREAVDLAKNMIELPRHPKYNLPAKRGSSAFYGRRRLMETLVRYELWEDILRLADTVYLEPSQEESDQIQRQTALALAAYHKEDADGIRTAKKPLEALLQKKRQERFADAEQAEETGKEKKKSARDIAQDMAEAMLKHGVPIGNLRSALAELNALIAILENRPQSAKEHLAKAKRIPKERLAKLHLRLGNPDKAVDLIEQAKASAPRQAPILAAAVEVFYAADKREEAALAFRELQEVSASLDPDAPIFQRITALTPELGIEQNWRRSGQALADAGKRPKLANLGPFRWSPWKAPDWNLSTARNGYRQLSDYQGKPLLLLFYLGHGCAHCVEQLNEMKPRVQEFADQGVDIAAVSTESLPELRDSLDKSELLGGIPFPLFSNADLSVFKEYSAFDDFENAPLHGAFLIDGNGFVLWQDIGYEPFTNMDFLLKESRRLLAATQAVDLAKAAE